MSTSSKKRTEPHSSRLRMLVSTSTILDETRRKKICGNLRSFSAHAEQKRSKLSGSGHYSRIEKPYNGFCSKWGSGNERDLFLSVQLLEDTPAIRSLGKLCEDHGCARKVSVTLSLGQTISWGWVTGYPQNSFIFWVG